MSALRGTYGGAYMATMSMEWCYEACSHWYEEW